MKPLYRYEVRLGNPPDYDWARYELHVVAPDHVEALTMAYRALEVRFREKDKNSTENLLDRAHKHEVIMVIRGEEIEGLSWMVAGSGDH